MRCDSEGPLDSHYVEDLNSVILNKKKVKCNYLDKFGSLKNVD